MKLFVPGRICLFGEHSDWAGGYRRINASIEKGYAIICGTNQGIYAEVEPHPTSLVLSSTDNDGRLIGPVSFPMEPTVLLTEAQKGGYWSYICGVAYQALVNHHVRGLTIHNYKTDLPLKKGLSSSAAICVLAARAFNRIYDLKLTIRGEMELAYQGEITTPSRCGRLDQGCAFGNRPVLMTFDGDRLDTSEFRVNQEHHLVVVDLHAKKDTLEILNRLNRCYPIADNKIEEGVQKLLGPVNREITHQAIDAMREGNLEQLGALMRTAQDQFDRYAMPICPEELTAPKLHQVLKHPAIQPFILGGKGIGSQGDGTAQLLVADEAAQEKVIEILERDLDVSCLKLSIKPGQRVRKAVIPAAGFGGHLFPATKSIQKEFFPVIDRDGIAKPAIFLIVDEALRAGIEEVYIVIQEGAQKDFDYFFHDQISVENYNQLPQKFQQFAREILEVGKQVRFIVQKNQLGFGHAVHCAKEAVGDEPFLLMLGDHIYRSHGDVSCAQQLIDAYQLHGQNIVGLRYTPENQIAHFGTISGSWLEPEYLLNITEFSEKPTVDFARNNLRVAGMPEDQYMTVFGQYILNPQIFELLEEQINNNVREHGKFQLTSALDRLRQYEGFTGLVINGSRFDIGLPASYLETLIEFQKN
ncbi:MAG: GHMP kinase [Anaerolineaceae bacterium]|nr:GHMP kinase [Anaerolineaceae bacterium]